jgi:Ca2+-binding RTX toxin-like protein
MSRRRLSAALLGTVSILLWPGASAADTLRTSATVSAQVTERKSTDFWVVQISWTAACHGAAGETWYQGNLYMIDVDTDERIYVGGVVDTSGQRSVSGTREWYVSSQKRPRRLRPELTIECYEHSPLKGGESVTTTGAAVIIPPSYGGGGGRSGGGGGNGGDNGDPTEPLRAGGCVIALLGTNGADELTGNEGSEVIIGFGARDRLRGEGGHDCLLGGSSNDRLIGGKGGDRLTGERGRDILVDRDGVNAFDAGPGRDIINARNGARELVRCGSGRDRALVDPSDRVHSCERLIDSWIEA